LTGRLKSPSAWLALAISALLCALICFGLMRPSRPSRPRPESLSRPQIEAAIAAVQVRLSANPQDIAALVELGMLHFESGAPAYPDAVNEFEEARRLGSLDSRLFYCLGVMYQELGLYPFALEEYQKHLRNFPEDKEVRMLAAKLCYRQGDYETAVKEYERLRYRDPKDPLITENLGLSLWGAKLTDRAVECFQALKAAGGLPARRAQFYLGQMAFEAGRFQEALDLMQRSLPAANEPDFGLPKDRMCAAVAMAWQKLGRPAEARDAWQGVLKLTPNDAKALAALRDLNRRFPQKRAKKR
jgi:tetratricopeptide (TPR) repeat protein